MKQTLFERFSEVCLLGGSNFVFVGGKRTRCDGMEIWTKEIFQLLPMLVTARAFITKINV